MEMEFRRRNNDLGVCVPTFQEKVNTMASEHNSAFGETSTAQALQVKNKPLTPHMPSSTEVEQTLTMVEHEAQQQNVELLRVHSGLDKERVSRLLALLQ